jgi:hypothetical protein
MRRRARYCAACGQKRLHVHDHSTWHLLKESFGDFFHFDSKFVATLKTLLIRPGFLTTEFLAGRRARYFEPFKLFLFISFLFFLTTGMIEHYQAPDTLEQEPGQANAVDSLSRAVRNKPKITLVDPQYADVVRLSDDTLRMLVKKEGLNKFVKHRYPHASWYTRLMLKQLIRSRLEGAENLQHNLEKTIPKLIFILIPIFALLLKLLYVRRRIPFFNHIIFSFHSLSFFFLAIWVQALLGLATSLLDPFFYLIVAVYLFIAMKRVYQNSFGKTLAKFLLLMFSSILVVAFFFILAVSISFMLL